MSYPSRLRRALLAVALGAVPIAAAGGALAVATTPPTPTPVVATSSPSPVPTPVIATPTSSPGGNGTTCIKPYPGLPGTPPGIGAVAAPDGRSVNVDWTMGIPAGSAPCYDDPSYYSVSIDGVRAGNVRGGGRSGKFTHLGTAPGETHRYEVRGSGSLESPPPLFYTVPLAATPTPAPQRCETPTAETANEPAGMQAQYGAGGGKVILNWGVGRGAVGETLCLDQPMSWDLYVDGAKIAGPIDGVFGGQYSVQITGRHVFKAVPLTNTSKVTPIYGAFTVPDVYGATPSPTPSTPPVTPTPGPKYCIDLAPEPEARRTVDQITETTARYTWNRSGCVFQNESRTVLLNGAQVYTTTPGAFQGSFTFKRLQPATTYTVTAIGDAPPWELNEPIDTITFTTASRTPTPTAIAIATPTTTPTPTPWITLSPAPRTPTPTPVATARQAYTLQGSTKLATLTKGTLPLTGSVDATFALATGDVTADLALNDTQGRLTALGFLPVTATVGFVSSGPTTGKLVDDRLTTTSKVRVRVRTVKAFGAIPLAGGNDCQTKQLSTITLSSTGPFDPTGTGGELAGTYRLSDLNGCGPFGGIVSALTAGDGNTITARLTPTS